MPLSFDSQIGLSTAERKETHLSEVYLTERYVFKFKKALLFPFCDYSTKEKRFQAAWDEIRLNRRGAPEIYLGIALFNRHPSGFLSPANHSLIVSSEFPPTDESYDEAAVMMKRIPDSDFLEQRLVDQTIDIASISQALSKFFSKCERITGQGQYADDLASALIENITSLGTLCTARNQDDSALRLLRYLKLCQREEFSQNKQLILSRAQNGFVVDGHGDLRLDHIAFSNSGVQIIDCVEFNRALRINDTCSELAFLAISFESRHKQKLARALEFSFFKEGKDASGPILLPLFKGYRALVRAKVHALRASQLGGMAQEVEIEARNHYLALATRNALRISGPALILVSGLMGSGKSTLSEQLWRILGCIRLNSDVIRKEEAGRALTAQLHEDFGKGLYSEEHTSRTYQTLVDLARTALEDGEIVVIDATLLKRRQRLMFSKLAADFNIIPTLIFCKVERSELLRRLNARTQSGQAVSEGRPELLEQQARQLEPIGSDEGFLFHEQDMLGLTFEKVFALTKELLCPAV